MNLGYFRIIHDGRVFSDDQIIPVTLSDRSEYYFFNFYPNCLSGCHSNDGLMLEMQSGLFSYQEDEPGNDDEDNLSVQPTVTAAFPFFTRVHLDNYSYDE